MRAQGTLKKWNDERGYGFIALPRSHEEIFVHVSAFQRSGIRPRIGAAISFDIRTGPDGRKRAENALSLGAAAAVREPRRKRGAFGTLVGVAALGAIGIGAYQNWSPSHRGGPGLTDSAELASPDSRAPGQQHFQCDGRTRCSQMTSCAEAVYFLQHCPNVELDGNNDGEPCEQQWCN